MPSPAAAPPPADPSAAGAEQDLRAALKLGAARQTLPVALVHASRHPDHLGIHLALAELAEAACRPAEQRTAIDHAIGLCRRRLAAAPRDWPLHETLARLHYRRGAFAEAWSAFSRLHRHQPADAAALLGLVKCGLPLARWEGLGALHANLIPPLVAEGTATASNLIALPIPGTAPALLAAGRIESQRLAAGLDPSPPRRIAADSPLRIGYVSPDFNDHAVAHQVPRVFELHDRARVRVHAYDIGHDDGSPYRRRVLAACDVVRDCRRLDDASAAALIAADGIDILVDLAGHTVGSRLGIFAWRPAPLQVAWLGYPATTGAAFIDYLVADPIVAPPAQRAHFSEALIHLPDCYLPADDRQSIAPGATRAAAGFPERSIVLAALHQPYKLEPEIFDTWLRILGRVPGAVLWLRAKDDAMQARLRDLAAESGVDPRRLIIDNLLLPKPEYLARLALADVFLDTRYFNGHSTVSDALWAGVPVVTTPGDAFAGRVAASILAASGLGGLVAPDLAAYEELVVRLASSSSDLDTAKARVAHARQHGRFFDAARFTVHLETAYASIAAHHRTGRPPADLAVPATTR